MLLPDEDRAREVGRALGDPELVETFVRADPQFSSVREILGKMGFVEGALYTAGVALVSYMLSARGEEHWAFAARFAEPPYDAALRRFVEHSPSLSRLRAQRLRRVEAYLSVAAPLLRRELEREVVDAERALRVIQRALGGSRKSKTLAFSVKMVLYAALASGKRISGVTGIPIPVDYRVSLLTLTSGMLEGWSCSDDLRRLASAARSGLRGVILRLWDLAAEEAGVPALLLDSVVWTAGRCVDENLERPHAIQGCVEKQLNVQPDSAKKISILWSLLAQCG